MTEICELKKQLISGAFSDIFANDLGYDDTAAAVKRAVGVLDEFVKIFPDEKCTLFSSPGRTELGGNHTDHQLGNVLAASINADMFCAAAITDSGNICVESEGFGKISIDLSETRPVDTEQANAAALIRGMAVWFIQHGYKITGVNAYITSDVPAGSGISSSASFEVLWGVIFNSFFAGGLVTKLEIAQAGLFAENEYFGKPCGLMDQTACVWGGIIAVNFENSRYPDIAEVAYDFTEKGYRLCIISTGGSHDDLTEDYAAIPSEMKSVAKLFGCEYLSELSQEIILNNADKIRRICGDRAFIRAVNYFEEDKRALLMKKALDNDDIAEYLKLVNISGRASWMYLQNVVPCGSVMSQNVAVALQAADISLAGRGAVRVHGGGFAGTIQAYVPENYLDKFVIDMERVLFKGCCRILKVRKTGAAALSLDEV